MSRAAGPAPAKPRAGRDVARPWVLPLVLTTLACIASGLAAWWLTIAPGYASPLSPAAAIALASVLVYGRRMLAGVALGALTVALVAHWVGGRHGTAAFVVPAVVALGAALQAGYGAVLVRRYVRQPLALSEPPDIAAFLAICAASSLIGASLSTAALGVSGLVPVGKLLATWGSCVLGDLAGLFIVTPIVLTVIGRPRA